MMHRASEAGFTLVELMVAVSLVALLSVLLFGGLRFGTRAADAVGGRSDQVADLALAEDFMQNELAGAQPFPRDPTADDHIIDFTGASDGLRFVSLPPAYLGLGGCQVLTVLFDTQGSDRRLVAAWSPLQRGPFSTKASARRPSILLDHVKSVFFAYFGVQAPNRPPAWSDHWANRRELPQLVRLRVIFADGRAAPDLVISARLGGPAQL